MAANWAWCPGDESIAHELRDFLPPRMFDAHAHLYRVADLIAATGVAGDGPREAGAEVWEGSLSRQVGAGRCTGGLFFPNPVVRLDRVDPANRFVIGQIRGRPPSRGLIVVHPGSDASEVDRQLADPQIVGFKVYHTFSPVRPTFDAPIESFLPEWAWQRADRQGLVIMLHLVRRKALADAHNVRYIRDRCERYGRAKLILAHAGRCFHAPNAAAGVAALGGLANVWFDTSGICEPEPLRAIIDTFGPGRLLWGSDFPVSETRGRCVTLGDGFAWLEPDTVDFARFAPHGSPTLVGLESLRALRQAVEGCGLSAEAVEDICAGNALRLLGTDGP